MSSVKSEVAVRWIEDVLVCNGPRFARGEPSLGLSAGPTSRLASVWHLLRRRRKWQPARPHPSRRSSLCVSAWWGFGRVRHARTHHNNKVPHFPRARIRYVSSKYRYPNRSPPLRTASSALCGFGVVLITAISLGPQLHLTPRLRFLAKTWWFYVKAAVVRTCLFGSSLQFVLSITSRWS
jgi:hypothetical protein